MKMLELAERTGVAKKTVLVLYHERGKGINFDTLNRLCAALNYQPGDLFEHIPAEERKDIHAAQV